jgi:hypothetical protein
MNSYKLFCIIVSTLLIVMTSSHRASADWGRSIPIEAEKFRSLVNAGLQKNKSALRIPALKAEHPTDSNVRCTVTRTIKIDITVESLASPQITHISITGVGDDLDSKQLLSAIVPVLCKQITSPQLSKLLNHLTHADDSGSNKFAEAYIGRLYLWYSQYGKSFEVDPIDDDDSWRNKQFDPNIKAAF